MKHTNHLTQKFSTITMMLIVLINYASSTIYIRAPRELAKQFSNGEIQGSISKFGRIPYGYNIVGSLYYDRSSLNMTKPFIGCTEEFSTDIKLNFKADIDESPIIMMDRGECSFVKKVTNAENFGAHAALIVNNDDEDISSLVMADDGNGKYVSIPAELISKSDGNKIKSFIMKNPNVEVTIEIDFEIVSLLII